MINAISEPTLIAQATTPKRGEDFDKTLQREQVRQSAAQLVSTTFIMPVLESMHDSPFLKEGPFAPGFGEKQFMPLLDQHLADRITSGGNFPLIDVIADRLLGDAS